MYMAADWKCIARDIEDRANTDGEYCVEIVYIKIIVSVNDVVICLFASSDAINYSCAVCMRMRLRVFMYFIVHFLGVSINWLI